MCCDLKNTVLKALGRIPALGFGDICDRHQVAALTHTFHTWLQSTGNLVNARLTTQGCTVDVPIYMKARPYTKTEFCIRLFVHTKSNR